MSEDSSEVCSRNGVNANYFLVSILDELGSVGSTLEGVQPLVEGGEEHLTEVEAPGVGVLGCNQLVQHLLGERSPVLVVLGHQPQRLLLPAPVLQHLQGECDYHFVKIIFTFFFKLF